MIYDQGYNYKFHSSVATLVIRNLNLVSGMDLSFITIIYMYIHNGLYSFKLHLLKTTVFIQTTGLHDHAGAECTVPLELGSSNRNCITNLKRL